MRRVQLCTCDLQTANILVGGTNLALHIDTAGLENTHSSQLRAVGVYFTVGVCMCFYTFSVWTVAPLKATGASSVGGNPAWDPAAATRLLQLMRKLMRVNVCDPSTHTTDSGLWSRDTVWPSLRLYKWSRSLLYSMKLCVTQPTISKLGADNVSRRIQLYGDAVWLLDFILDTHLF